MRGVENVPYEGGPKPLFGRGVIREVFHPPPFSTPPWRPLNNRNRNCDNTALTEPNRPEFLHEGLRWPKSPIANRQCSATAANSHRPFRSSMWNEYDTNERQSRNSSRNATNAGPMTQDQFLCFGGRYELQRTLAIRIAAITLASDPAITIARFRPSKMKGNPTQKHPPK